MRVGASLLSPRYNRRMEPDSRKPKAILYRDDERVVIPMGCDSQVYSFDDWDRLDRQLRNPQRARVIPFPVPAPR